MRHFGFLDHETSQQLFEVEPERFSRRSPPEVLAVSLGATLYSPSTRADLAGVVRRQAARGVTSMVLCLEDAIADIDVTTARAQSMTAEQAATLTALTEQVSAAIHRLDDLTV